MSDDNKKIRLGSELDPSGIRKGADEAKGVVRDLSQTVQRESAVAGKAVDGIGEGGKGAADKLDRATRNMQASIERATARFEAGKAGAAGFYEALAPKRGVDLSVLQPALDKLRQAEAASKAAASGVDKIGVSAAQTAAALRGVPAQFSDIVASLQGGQAPLSVFLQQGGQLKDMFGGAGAAAKALGGYVLSLVNPFTVAAVAVAGLAVAYNAGANEGQAFRRELILSGNVAGVTAGQLTDMAAAVKALGAGTQGRASEVLLQLAGAGSVGAESFTRFTAAALALEKAGGPAADATAKAFSDLGRAPLEASKKLNDSTNFLTASTYAQIKALTDQGRAIEAARVAQEAYAAAVEDRAPKLLENLGLVERAWLGIKSAAKGAVDATLNIGREAGALEQIAKLQERIAAAKVSPLASQIVPGLETQLQLLKQQQFRQMDIAQAAGLAAEQHKAGVKWLDEGDKFLSRQQQRERDILRIRNEGLAAGASEEEIRKRIAVVEERYDPGTRLQAIKDEEAQRLELITRGQAKISALREQGLITERTAMTVNTHLALQQIDTRISAVTREKVLVDKRRDSERESAALQGQLDLLTQQRITAELKGREEIATALAKQKKAIEAVIEAQRQEYLQDTTDALVRQSKAREELALSMYEWNRSVQDEADAMALEIQLLGASSTERATRLAQLRIELDLRKRLEQINATDYVGGEADREDARAQARAIAARAMAQASARATLDEWQKTSEAIYTSLSDALIRGFEAGKSPAENLRDTVENMFKTMVLKLTIQAAVGTAGGAISNALGLATGSSAGNSGASLVSNLSGLYSTGSALYSAGGKLVGFLGGSSAAAGTVSGGSGLATAGSTYGTIGSNAGTYGSISGSSASLGTGSSSSAAGAAGWAALAVLAAMQGSSDYSAGFRRQQADSSGTLLGKGSAATADLFSRLGVSDRIADIISGATLTARLFGRSAPQVTATGISGSLGSGQASVEAWANVFEKGGWFRSDKNTIQTSAVSTELNKFLNDSAKAVLDQAKDWGKALGLPAEQLASITTQIRVQLGDDAAANKQAITDALTGYADALASGWGDQVATLKAYGETTAQTVQRVGTAIADVNQVLALLGEQALSASVSGGQAAVDLEAAFGGLDNLKSSAASFLQDFYSDAERSSIATTQLRTELQRLGINTVPTTREAYRALVEQQDLTTTSGRSMYAALLQLAPAFASVVEATTTLADTSAEAAAKIAEAGRQALATLAGDQAGLQVSLLQAQGNTAGAAALQRQQDLAKITTGLSPQDAAAATAAYDYNAALRDQIKALGDATTAAQAAAAAEAQRAAAVAAERTGLETQLLQLQGNTTALRERELAALDPSNQALQQRIYALQDEQAAAQAAAASLQQLQGNLSSLASTRVDLQAQLLTLQGNPAEAARITRERDLAQLTAGLSQADADRVTAAYDLNVALRKQIDDTQAAQQAAQDAAQAQAQAAQQAAQAAAQVREAWQGVADSLFDEVLRIRGLVAGSSPATLGAAQAQFAVATAQARAGDQEAAKTLPTLSQTLLTLAEQQAGSYTDLQILRAQIAASLQATGSQIAGQYGLTVPGAISQPATAAADAGSTAMVSEVQQLRADNAAQASALATLQLRLVKLLERWETDGIPEARTTT